MRRRTAAVIVAAGTAGAVAVGGGLSAWATWAVSTTSGKAVLTGDTLPAVKKPDAGLAGELPTVSWKAVRFGSGQAVGGYLVLRNDGGDQTEVCRVPATTLSCIDRTAVVGRAVTYTVRATAGDRWAGPPSPISDLVIRPGGPGAASLAAGTPEPSPRAGDTAGSSADGSGESGEAPAGGTAEPGGTAGTPVSPAGPSSSAEASSAAPAPSVTERGGTDPE